MKKIVFYSFYDNYRRYQLLDLWRKRYKEEAASSIYVEATPWLRHPQARKLGRVFLHSGDPRSIRMYERFYKPLGLPEMNVRKITPPEKQVGDREVVSKKTTGLGIDILEITPSIRKSPSRRKKEGQ